MVSKGKQEPALVDYVVAHRSHYPRHLRELVHAHVHAFKEYLTMRNVTPEQLGLLPADLDELAELLALDGPQRLLRPVRAQALLEEAVRRQGPQALLEEAVRRLGPDQARALLEQLSQPTPGNGGTTTPSP